MEVKIPIPNEKQASSFRRYFMEYAVLGLTLAVCLLFYMYIDINNFIRTDLMHDKIETRRVLDAANRAAELQHRQIIFNNQNKTNEKDFSEN